MIFQKQIYIYLLAFISILGSCDVDSIVGSGVVATESRPITEFNSIYIEGSYNLNIRQGDSYKLFLKMDDNLLDNTITEIDGDVLHIKNISSVLHSSANDIYVTVKDIDNITLVGSINLSNSNVLTLTNFSVIGAGSCDIDMNIHSNSIFLELAGSSKVNLKGVTHSLDIEMAGYGDFNSLDLYSENVTLNISGAVSSKVFSKDYLDVNISGTGKVFYKGNPVLIKETSRNGRVLPLKSLSK